MSGQDAKVKPDTKRAPEDEEPGSSFNPNDYAWQDHLKVALDELTTKGLAIDRVWRYYDNDHPKVWMTEAIRKRLDDQLVNNMAENWCDTAVDAPVQRTFLEGFNVKLKNSEEGAADPVSADMAWNVWDDNQMDLRQKEIYTQARGAGEAFIGAWKDDELEHGFRLSIMDPRNVWWPDDTWCSKPARVVQVWPDKDDGVWRATCYYKYVVVRLVGEKLVVGSDTQYMPELKNFTVDSKDPGGLHGFEEVPVFRLSRTLKRRSIIDQIRSTQDKINKLGANMMVNSEFNAWRKMIVMTEQTIEDGDLEFRPNRILKLDPGGGEDGPAPTSVWEGTATELSIYSDEQEKLINKLFTKATLPGHLKVKDDRAVPSGVAYEADEGPFIESIIDMHNTYGACFRDMFEVMLGIEVECQWRNPAIKSDKDEMETVKLAKEAGVPLELSLKKYAGWTKPELDELQEAPLSAGEQMQMALTQNMVNSMGGESGANPVPRQAQKEAVKQVGGGNAPAANSSGPPSSKPKPTPPQFG